jgi:hypothetical protein
MQKFANVTYPRDSSVILYSRNPQAPEEYA